MGAGNRDPINYTTKKGEHSQMLKIEAFGNLESPSEAVRFWVSGASAMAQDLLNLLG